MRRDEAEEIVAAIKNHRNDTPGLALANSEYERATGPAHNEVTLGKKTDLTHFLSDVGYFGVTKNKLSQAGIIVESGEMLHINIGKLWEAAHQAPEKPAPIR